jgi:hypothetical protein
MVRSTEKFNDNGNPNCDLLDSNTVPQPNMLPHIPFGGKYCLPSSKNPTETGGKTALPKIRLSPNYTLLQQSNYKDLLS